MKTATMKTATTRLNSEDRRAAIIKAVQRVFAEKGFDGTTTRELAEQAGARSRRERYRSALRAHSLLEINRC